MTTHNQHNRELLEAVREACFRAAVDAYEEAGIRGLCSEGRWEYALGAIRTLDLTELESTLESAGTTEQTARPHERGTSDGDS